MQTKREKILTITLIVIIAIIGILYLFDDEEYYDDYPTYSASVENCNVAGIEIHGDLWTYEDSFITQEFETKIVGSEDIVVAIHEAQNDKNIKAIILEIDSYGGLPIAGEEVANALKRASLPTIALIRGGGLSASYWASTGADTIIASENSDIGSIGITMSYLDNARSNLAEGLTYNQLSYGKYKDTGDPDKTLTYAEKQYLMRDVNIVAENFIKAVSENRSLDIEKVRALADGSSMLGAMALENGLIDKIGDLQTTKEYLEKEIGKPVEICWFE